MSFCNVYSLIIVAFQELSFYGRHGGLGWETNCNGRLREGGNTKGPGSGGLNSYQDHDHDHDHWWCITIILKRWSSTIWKRTPGPSFHRSWRLEDMPFLPFLSQGDDDDGYWTTIQILELFLPYLSIGHLIAVMMMISTTGCSNRTRLLSRIHPVNPTIYSFWEVSQSQRR